MANCKICKQPVNVFGNTLFDKGQPVHAECAQKGKSGECVYCGNEVDNMSTHVKQMHPAMEDYDTQKYEVDVDELIKTGEPVEKLPTDKRSYNVESSYGKQEIGKYGMDISDPSGKNWICPDCGSSVPINDKEWIRGHLATHSPDQLKNPRYEDERSKQVYNFQNRGYESIKEDVYNFIKIQSGGVPAYSRMMHELGYSQMDITKAVDELKQEGRISSSFGDRTSHNYPEKKNPFKKGTTDADFGGSGEWYWNAEAHATELDHYEQKQHQSQKDWNEDLEDIRKELQFKESWDFRSFNDKVESFESLGFTQGDAVKLASLNWYDLSTEVQQALEVEDDNKEGKRNDGVAAYDRLGFTPKTEIDDLDNIDYNVIKESYVKTPRHECEYCNSTFTSNESLAIHYNDIHAVNQFNLDGYENSVLGEAELQLPMNCPECKAYIADEGALEDHEQKTGHNIISPNEVHLWGENLKKKITKTVAKEFVDSGTSVGIVDIGASGDYNLTVKGDGNGTYSYEMTHHGHPEHGTKTKRGMSKEEAEDLINTFYSNPKRIWAQAGGEVKIYEATETVAYAAEDGEFREEDHPRADDGKFTSKGSGGSSGGTKQVEKPKPSKYFNKAKDRALKIIGEPKDEYDRKKYNAVKNLDGYPTHSSQLRGIGAGAKAAIMKAHLTDTYGGIFGARKDGYREVVPMWKGGSAYPYGAGQLVKVYSDHGASNMMVDYSDTDTYVFGVRDERPDRPKWDGSNVADTREQRFAEWIASWAYSKENPAGSSINPKKLGWNDWNNLAKWTLEGKSSGFSDSSRDLNVKFSDLDDIKRQFLEQEQKEGGAQPAQDVPKATTPAFHTQQYMGEDPDKPDQIPIDPETGEELPVSKYNPLEHKYKPSDPTKATKKDVVRAYGDLKGNKARADKLEDIAPDDDPTYGAEPWQKGGESLDDVYAEITNTATESIANEVEWMCMDCEKKLTETPREHQDKTGHHNISKYKAGRDDEFITEKGMYGYGSATGRMSPRDAWNQSGGGALSFTNPIFEEFASMSWDQLPQDIQELWKADLEYMPSGEAYNTTMEQMWKHASQSQRASLLTNLGYNTDWAQLDSIEEIGQRGGGSVRRDLEKLWDTLQSRTKDNVNVLFESANEHWYNDWYFSTEWDTMDVDERRGHLEWVKADPSHATKSWAQLPQDVKTRLGKTETQGEALATEVTCHDCGSIFSSHKSYTKHMKEDHGIDDDNDDVPTDASFAEEFKPENQGKKIKLSDGSTATIQSVGIFSDDVVTTDGKTVKAGDYEIIGEVETGFIEPYDKTGWSGNDYSQYTKCGMCGKEFETRKELEDHVYGLGPHSRASTEGFQQGLYGYVDAKCKTCGLEFASISDMDDHYREFRDHESNINDLDSTIPNSD